ncbi:hypothetical protein OAC62_05875, partial [Amylibacter sp.]|nr:hypothetical protein [Amylibacter sp.]
MKHLCNLLIVLSFIVTLFNPTVGYAKTEVKSIFTDITGGIDKSDRSIRYLQARVKFNNMVIDGLLFGSPSIRFKISQPPGRNISYALILSSGNSLLNINKNNNKNGGYSKNKGYKYWIRSGENITLRAVSNDFSSRQIKALKSMCGFLSDPNNMKKNIINLLETKSRRMDPSVKRIFTVRTNIEFSKLALNCKNAIDRKIIGYETLSKRQAPKLCGVETIGVSINTRALISIQNNLKILGFYNGKIDGIFGKGSCKSLADYNSSIGKTVTTKYSKFYINSLKEKAIAKLNSAKISQTSKETESEVAILEAEKKEAAILEISNKEIAKKEAAILEAAKKEEAAILEAAKKEAAEIVEAAK